MKKQLHPKYNTKATITCNSCKTVYVLGSTVDDSSIEVCANCHPHYTGQENVLVDSDSRIDKFQKQLASVDKDKVIKKRKKVAARKTKTTEVGGKPKLTLHDMLKQVA